MNRLFAVMVLFAALALSSCSAHAAKRIEFAFTAYPEDNDSTCANPRIVSGTDSVMVTIEYGPLGTSTPRDSLWINRAGGPVRVIRGYNVQNPGDYTVRIYPAKVLADGRRIYGCDLVGVVRAFTSPGSLKWQ